MSLALIRFLPTTANLPFIKIRMWAIAFSLFLVLGSLFEFANVGINFGIDFRGGIQTEVRTEEPADVEAMRTVVGDLNLGEPRIQQTGNPREVLISLPLQPGEGLEGEEAQQDARRALEAALETNFPGIELRGTDVIGGAVSGELVVKGFMAVTLALFLMLIYIWFQFEWQFSVGAILALTHDVIATVEALGLGDQGRYIAALTFGNVHGSFAMIWGVVIGTYSSIFVAAPLLLLVGVKRDASEND